MASGYSAALRNAKLDVNTTIVSAAQRINLASQAPLKAAGTVTLATAPAGKVFQFRQNGYVETETLPAIGTSSFVEFWVGYPSSTITIKGSSADPSFLTGSSSNNIGLAAAIGGGNGAVRANWGAIYSWPTMNDAGEALTPGVFTVLVVVRRQSGMEFWRNGRLIRFIAQAPTNYVAGSLICGSFVEDTGYWPSNSDTMLAGRALTPTELTPGDIRAFSENPWQIFQAPARQLWVASSAPSTPSASLAWTEADEAVSVTALLTNRIGAIWTEAGDVASIAAAAIDRAAMLWTEGDDTASLAGVATDRASIAWTEQGDSAALTGAVANNTGPVAVNTALSWTEAGDTAALSALAVDRTALAWAEQGDTWALQAVADYALSVRYADATIMRLSVVQGTTNLGPDRLQQTTGFP